MYFDEIKEGLQKGIQSLSGLAVTIISTATRLSNKKEWRTSTLTNFRDVKYQYLSLMISLILYATITKLTFYDLMPLPDFQFQTEETRKSLEVLPEYNYLLFFLGKKFCTV